MWCKAGFILVRGLLPNDNPASTRKSRRIVGVFILGSCAIPALGIKNRIIRYSIFHSILDTCISPKYRLTDHWFIRYSIYRSIAIPPSIDIERSQVSRYFDISSIEPALNGAYTCYTLVLEYTLQCKVHFNHFSTTGLLRCDHWVRHSQRLRKKINCVTSNQDFNSTT